MRRWSAAWMVLGAVLASGCGRARSSVANAPAGGRIDIVARVPDATAFEVEREIAVPIEQAVAGIAGISRVDSESWAGGARVTLTFASAEHLATARAEVTARLLRVPEPSRLQVTGDVALDDDGLRYTLRGGANSFGEIYTLNERLRPRLLRVPALAEVSTCHGSRDRFVVSVDAARMARAGLAFRSLLDAVAPPEPARRARATTLRDLDQVLVGVSDRIPVRVADVATVTLGYAPFECAAQRGGDAGFNVVEGITRVRRGARADEAIAGLRDAIEAIRAEHLLPPGIAIEPFDFTEGANARRLPTFAVRVRLTAEEERARAIEAVRTTPGVHDVLTEARGAGRLDLDIRAVVDDGSATEAVAAAAVARLTGLSAAVRSDVSIAGRPTPDALRAATLRLVGADLASLRSVAGEAANALRGVRGIEAVGLVGAGVAPRISVALDAGAIARYGLAHADVAMFARAATGGLFLGEIGDIEPRTDVFVRVGSAPLPAEAVARLTLAQGGGGAVALSSMGTIRSDEEPSVIRRADGRRFVEVSFDVRGRSRVEGLEEARAKLRDALRLPADVTATLDDKPL
ncbi:MAG: efflux RND transporter permease subunit [Minicystis sp.]